jgi:hypothetical protein
MVEHCIQQAGKNGLPREPDMVATVDVVLDRNPIQKRAWNNVIELA